jgi:hypothetical protein
MVAGPVVGIVPGPGGSIVFLLGLALVAMESRRAAHFLDRLEPKLRRGWERGKKAWRSLPAGAKVAISLLGMGLVGAMSYIAYALVSGS